MTDMEDSIVFGNFTGCASSREVRWHLAADRPEQYDRFPGAQSWIWVPGEGCEDLEELDAAQLVRVLIIEGGWYLLGGAHICTHSLAYWLTQPYNAVSRLCNGESFFLSFVYTLPLCSCDT